MIYLPILNEVQVVFKNDFKYNEEKNFNDSSWFYYKLL